MPHPLISFEYVVQNVELEAEDVEAQEEARMAEQHRQQQQQWLDYSNEQFRQQQQHGQQQQRPQIPMASEAEAFHPQMYKVVPRDSVQQR